MRHRLRRAAISRSRAGRAKSPPCTFVLPSGGTLDRPHRPLIHRLLARLREGRGSDGNRRMAGGVRCRRGERRPRTRDVSAAQAARSRTLAPRAAAAGAEHALREHGLSRGAAAVPRQYRYRAAHHRDRALECARDGRAREPRLSRARRASRDVCIDRRLVRSGLQSLLPRRSQRRSRFLSASRRAGRLRACFHRRPPHRRTPRALSA